MIPLHTLCDLFPPADAETRNGLEADIKKNGLREKITLYGGKILDGRTRYNACRAVGVELEFENYECEDPLGFVISKNLNRRQLTTKQRAMVAAKIATMKQGERTDKKEPSAKLPKVSQAEAAKALSVSTRSVTAAKAELKETETAQMYALHLEGVSNREIAKKFEIVDTAKVSADRLVGSRISKHKDKLKRQQEAAAAKATGGAVPKIAGLPAVAEKINPTAPKPIPADTSVPTSPFGPTVVGKIAPAPVWNNETEAACKAWLRTVLVPGHLAKAVEFAAVCPDFGVLIHEIAAEHRKAA